MERARRKMSSSDKKLLRLRQRQLLRTQQKWAALLRILQNSPVTDDEYVSVLASWESGRSTTQGERHYIVVQHLIKCGYMTEHLHVTKEGYARLQRVYGIEPFTIMEAIDLVRGFGWYSPMTLYRRKLFVARAMEKLGLVTSDPESPNAYECTKKGEKWRAYMVGM
jgi:hypothetical protein